MRRNRGLRWLIFALTLYAALCTVGGVYLADGTLHPGRRGLADDDAAGFRDAVRGAGAELNDASITTSDGTILRGWMLRPAHPNGDAALLLHGLGDNRLGMAGYAQLLLARGFAVLLPDARAHGVSGGTLATFGLLERNDIHQWAEYLTAAVQPRCVYGLGESMGAAQLLQALEVGTHFCAVVAESSFSTFREIAYDRMGQPFGLGPWVGRVVLRPLVEVAFLRARWKYGLDMQQVSPEDAVARARVPILLIHGQIDSNIPVRHSRVMHAGNLKTVLWEVPGADHCGAIAVAPQEFESRLLGWFEGARSSAPKSALTTKGTKVHEGKDLKVDITSLAE
ncbi:MAG TPA: alpha/beta fold hydrolase [Candidatus Dormibacteraeota bacterium]|nr:alpha/beta fold hydrolase [Candidatus Dormibacteraeota bacterium]